MTAAEAVGVFFETPDVRRVLGEGAFWDIYFEHCSYFTLGSHARLFRRAGMDVTRLYLAYDDQYIIQYAEPVYRPSAAARRRRPRRGARAGEGVSRKGCRRPAPTGPISSARATVRAGAWRSGAADPRPWSFLTTNGLGDEVAQVIDINPFKQGRFLPGTGHLVTGPEKLKQAPPDTVIVMNPIYLAEIGADLAAMGLSPELVAV